MKSTNYDPLGNLDDIKNSVAAVSPTMQLAKEEATKKYERFEKIVLGDSNKPFLGASKQPVPEAPKFELDENLFGDLKIRRK